MDSVNEVKKEIELTEDDEVIGGDIACLVACGVTCFISSWTATAMGVAFTMA